MFQFTVTVLSILVVCQSQVIPIDKYKQQLLDLHNEYRSMQKGTDMQELIWDDTLAKEAEDWVGGCRFEHQRKTRGENLAYDSNSNSVEEKINSSMKAWYDEIKTYNYNGKRCAPGRACHYTQMVWSKTRAVGCGMKQCDWLHKSGGSPTKNAWYLGCFYFPKGNDNSQFPYLKGTPCSACTLEGQTCDARNLCTGGSEVDLNPCENLDDMCKQWSKEGQCQANRSFMEQSCAKACGFCHKEGQVESEEEELPCEDKNASCATWSKTGQCERNPSYMEEHCRKSCSKC